MSDWSTISIEEFDGYAAGNLPLGGLVPQIILDRLPFVFESKSQYLDWRDAFAEDIGIDGRDVALVGSAATGRSLSSKKRFGVFNSRSDLDIAVISRHHFEQAWEWFRRSDINLITGLDDVGRKKFQAHLDHYIFEGVIASEYFLSYFPWGTDWLHALRRTERYLPSILHGKQLRVRIYQSNSALRSTQKKSLEAYRVVAKNKLENKLAMVDDNE